MCHYPIDIESITLINSYKQNHLHQLHCYTYWYIVIATLWFIWIYCTPFTIGYVSSIHPGVSDTCILYLPSFIQGGLIHVYYTSLCSYRGVSYMYITSLFVHTGVSDTCILHLPPFIQGCLVHVYYTSLHSYRSVWYMYITPPSIHTGESGTCILHLPLFMEELNISSLH